MKYLKFIIPMEHDINKEETAKISYKNLFLWSISRLIYNPV